MRSRTSGRGAAESGFTLIEIMIAMIIMGVGLLTIALAQLTAMRISTESRQMTQAMYLAEQQLDAFYITPPAVPGAFVDPLNPIELDPNDQDYTTFTRSWTIQGDTPSLGLSTVTVQVLWNNGAGGAGGAGGRTVTLQGIVGP